ncbi:hypothetical protein B0H12DRAFT_1157927 [Mycena haematopus]|nr:hypothetical protein B0H12DRAFT_1157927 [Mycena haematopus]
MRRATHLKYVPAHSIPRDSNIPFLSAFLFLFDSHDFARSLDESPDEPASTTPPTLGRLARRAAFSVVPRPDPTRFYGWGRGKITRLPFSRVARERRVLHAESGDFPTILVSLRLYILTTGCYCTSTGIYS